MTKIFKNKLREKEGGMFILIVSILLIALIVLAGVSEYMRLQIIAKGVRDAVQSAVISVSTENYENVYSSSREAYSAGYKYDENEEEWKENIDTGDVYKKLDDLLGLEKDGGYHVKKIDSEYEYKLSNLKVEIINSPLKSNDKFSAETFINLEVPLSFGWEHLPPMKIRLKVKSEYMAKF
ncbi:hypothetical protein [Sporanaerobacter acetigenes]|uniref:Flp pilus-assembly TadE/G-like n=1 Tax=Sporanaerobacter acetigenes DSM 13106 TaxID=1123281 RepID=A0A1M5U7G4_9FIRM|nr:hypothetical protein [Sporanaerobacter acetigenes]SHH58904.1 hypothetical protein SAMN02745180_00549 [Sporanaerobacter acetigenes DSM 13106]